MHRSSSGPRAIRRRLFRQLFQKPTVALGVIVMLAWTVISILAPVIALHDPIEMTLDARLVITASVLVTL